jgi:hypothetical protein
MTEKNIQGGFRGAGLIPMNPESVISKLDAKFKTPTPPGTSHGESEPWTCKTPTNPIEFAKGTQGIMHQILEDENSTLSRRQRAKKLRLREGGSMDQVAQKEVDIQMREETKQNRSRATRATLKKHTCSVCGKTGHNARTCQMVLSLSAKDDEE